MADGKQVGNPVPFTVESTSITAPAVPAKVGYTGAWEAYTLKAENFTVNAVYTPITYYVTFMADGVEVAKVPFTVESTSITAPTVPAKVGYTGAWETYTLKAENFTVNAVYTPVVYTATFVADGVEVAKIPFTVEDKSIAEPAVPAKAGYTGAWEAYTLGAEDITINAVYTPVSEAPNSTDSSTTPIVTPIVDIVKNGNLWWILIVIAVIIILVVIFFIIRSKKNDDDDNTPPPAEEPAPESDPESDNSDTEETEAVETEAVAVEPEVESVTVDEVDDLMTDDDALAAVIVVENDAEESTGPKEIINISDINDNFSDGETVNIDTLKEKNMIPENTERLKVLASGSLNKHDLRVEANSFSVQAIKMIQLMGGTVVKKK